MKHPCINVCNGWARDDGICSGCHRNLDEVRDWLGYTEEEKITITELIEERRSKDEEGRDNSFR